MKILVANKYYYQRGGADIHSIDLEGLLKSKGHDVAFFSMHHPLNMISQYSDYFPEGVNFDQPTNKDLIAGMIRPFGAYEVRRKFKKLLRDFKPDIVHLHNVHTQLSPVLALIAKRNRIPVLWTIHDHKLICPRYDCMRNGSPCELCFTRKYNVVRYKCMKNSTLASIVALLEHCAWNKKVLSRNTDVFICPSEFLLKNMIKGGYRKEKLIHLPNFILENKLSEVKPVKKNYYCFIGRLSPEKGIETLLKAAIDLPQFKLKIIGTGPLENTLKAKYQRSHIDFMGFREWDGLKDILSNARCMIFPSECYENNPLSIIESLCLGTPVIGSRIGGIIELLDQEVNGLTYESGNVDDLRNQIVSLFSNESKFNYSEISRNAIEKFRSEKYYANLINYYTGLLNKNLR
ncbi:MAG: glycosyltransferase family 4 protein [Bacteroidales bacterium]|jgi:glycosyltransferase involved in cell wall biosynthesis